MSEHIHLGEIASAASGARRVDGIPFPLSRRTDPVSVHPGTRAIVRYLLTDGEHAGKATDVIGVIRSVDPLVIDSAQRTQLTLDASSVVVLKTLSAAPVRNSDIRAVEAATAAAFPGIQNTMIGHWLARAGDGITERSNSAVPIGPNAGVQPVPLEEITAFYQEHNLPTMLLLPDRIGRTAESLPGERGPEIIVMTRELDDLDDVAPELELFARSTLDLRLDDHPTPEWLSMYHFRGKPLPEKALRLLTEKIDGQMCFASLYVDGHLAAITRGTITEGGSRNWLGFSAVEVAEGFRRRGLASAMGAAMLTWGAKHGAHAAYLDVIASNIAGRALYHRLGFSEHHRHRSLTVHPGK
ncbi:GNAT family N-acetyltransferase [Corynebacterium sp. 320]|uniref:N-acetylglutamate synthase, CG3035 family n=1 Tax=Corynebacterium TaxID=1716 RepID=UPI00125CBAF6|nr:MULTISPECIES: GNAT family N-acetyltransferase [Corynebacterium]KAB1503079.1 GNAT family N-acetyltransferase [Corynebacterium sp. 320]KAB1550710.1 GNAT family N-acetyltransferase [Corynebacterium sp. 321]KAB1551069.1 GNAT family N-acetyltransferase [Corynebacterium sp. 319]KAB3526876.1 GNAT family N-acetyltransferase [Corynebacterium sp. 250]KAB3538369.1 GNAT family N-acetyltransferase [Corynebacterium sp. 366]